jgi:hypothetical protein
MLAAMPRLRLQHGSTTRDVLLAPSSLVGRHWACVGRLPVAGVPLYWLEVRWLGEGWGWRELTPRAQTRGAGEALADGWRSFVAGVSVRWSDDVRVELVDGGPPGPACVALDGETTPLDVLAGDSLADLLEITPEGARPLGDDTFPARWLDDGAVFVAALPGEPARAWRWLRGDAPLVTARDGFTVTHPDVTLDLQRSPLAATFTLRRQSATIRGETARMLTVYALARHEEAWDDGGFLTASEAITRWEALGGSLGGPAQRAAWERGRLRTQLSAQGVRGLGELFERGRRAGEPTFRLAMHPRNLDVGCDDDA